MTCVSQNYWKITKYIELLTKLGLKQMCGPEKSETNDESDEQTDINWRDRQM